MKIQSWMRHPVVTVKPRDSILHAREVMEKHRFNQLPVVIDGRLAGIVTDRDLRDAFPSVFEGRPRPAADPSTIQVEEVMTSGVLTLGPGAPVAEAARLMRRQRIGAIPIVDGGHLVGILTRSDLLAAFLAVAEAPAL
jgi:acetoin utilization protein AcuB